MCEGIILIVGGYMTNTDCLLIFYQFLSRQIAVIWLVKEPYGCQYRLNFGLA